jgi:hypothetical protein
MSITPRLRNICLVVGVVVIGGYIFCPGILLYPYDAWRLARFASRVKNSDRMVVICGSASTEIGEGDTKRVIRALASAASIRPPLFAMIPAAWSIKASFMRGTNVLGDIDTCVDAFRLQGSGAPFEDRTGVLFPVALEPAAKAFGEAK